MASLGDTVAHVEDVLAEYESWCADALEDRSAEAPIDVVAGVSSIARAVGHPVGQRSGDAADDIARAAALFRAMLLAAWPVGHEDEPPVIVDWEPLGKTFWHVVRGAGALIVQAPEQLLVTNATASAVLSQLALSGGHPDIAEAVAATQAFFFAAYSTLEGAREGLREAVFSVAEALAARTATIGAMSDALLLGSVLRLLRPFVSGFGASDIERRRVCLNRLATVTSAFAAPKAFDAFGGPVVDVFRGITDGAIDEDQDAAAAEFIASLAGRCNNQTGHAELAGLVRLIGATVAGISRRAFEEVCVSVTRALCRGVASEVASVTVAASTAVRAGLIPFATADFFVTELPAVVRALVREGRQHWDVDAALELGQTWRELQDAVGERRWEAVVDSVVRAPGTSAEVREYPAKLLARCDFVEAQRAADASTAELRRSEAVAALGAKPVLRRLDFVFGRELGSGAFASVRFAKFIEPEVPQSQWLSVAVKSVAKSVMCLSEEGAAALEREAVLHAELTRDPDARQGIVQLYARFDDGAHSLCFIQELGTHGDLHGAVSVSGIAHDPARGVLAVKGMHGWIRRVLLHVHATLSRMHAVGVMYGDLKPENVLVAPDGRARLCDFGSAMRLDLVRAGDVSLGGTLHFLPPEALAETRPSAFDGRSVDWWSFAVTTVFALTGHLIVDDADTVALRLKLRQLTAREAVRAALFDAVGAAAVERLPNFVIDVLSMSHEMRGAEGGSMIASDPFFTDCAPPFSDHSVPMPVRLRVTAAGSAPSSGRKQSVMWRRHVGADTSSDSVSLALDVLSGERAMAAEGPGTPAMFTFTPFALNNPKAKEPTPSRGYMTVMPPQRR